MKVEELTIPAVRAVVTAMRDGDREAFFAAFTPSAKLTDDGQRSCSLSRSIERSFGRMVN